MNIFNISNNHASVVSNPQWEYVRQGMLRNLTTTMRYWHNNAGAVSSSHFLVRLIGSLATPMSLNTERYYSNVESKSDRLSMALGMTSPVYKGKLFKNAFYNGCDEVLISNSDLVDIDYCNKNWKNLQPVKVLRHPFSDIELGLPNTKTEWIESGMCVISIDIPLLALQYRAFCLNEVYISDRILPENMENNTDRMLTVEEFIRMYVLPNMLPSHLDIAVMNRMINLYKEAPLGKCLTRSSFYLIDYSSKMDALLKERIAAIKQTKTSFYGILKNLPAIVKKDMWEVMQLPDVAPSRQVTWALVLSRLNFLSFVFRLVKDSPNIVGQSEINYIHRVFTNLKTDNVIATIMPIDVMLDVFNEISEIENITS